MLKQFFASRLLFFLMLTLSAIFEDVDYLTVIFEAVSREIYVHISVNKNMSKSCWFSNLSVCYVYNTIIF
jgi:hypothetical protein